MRTILCCVAALLLSASIAHAQGCDPPLVLLNAGDGFTVHLGGWANGVVDARARKLITVRDCGNNPLPNAAVTITFTNCTDADIRLCDEQPAHPGALFDCAAKTVTAVTNQSGVAAFLIAGNANNVGNSPGVGMGCASVRVDGVLVGNLSVAAPDQNGIGGVTAADLSAFGGDRFGAYRGRSDMNGDGVVTGADLTIFGHYRFGQGSVSSCGSVCL